MRARRIFADFTIFVRGYLRNSIALFFSLFFPVILIVIFGAIYSGTASTHVPLAVQNLDGNSALSQSFLKILNGTGTVTVNFVSPPAGQNLSTYLTQNSLAAGLLIPANFSQEISASRHVNLSVYVNPAEQVTAGAVRGAVGTALFAFTLQLTHSSPLVGATTQNLGNRIFNQIDYLVPGLIGFTILTSPMFAMVDITATYRKEKLFRQLSLTPLTKGEWLTSKILWYIVLTLISAALMISLGDVVFGAHAEFSWGILPFLVLGPFFFVSLGMLAGSLTNTPETAAVIGNVVTFPMMFLSGTFFPVTLFPHALQTIARGLPLYYVIDGMNAEMLFANTGQALTDAVIVLVLSLVVFLAALLAFKWRDE